MEQCHSETVSHCHSVIRDVRTSELVEYSPIFWKVKVGGSHAAADIVLSRIFDTADIIYRKNVLLIDSLSVYLKNLMSEGKLREHC